MRKMRENFGDASNLKNEKMRKNSTNAKNTKNGNLAFLQFKFCKMSIFSSNFEKNQKFYSARGLKSYLIKNFY